MYRSTLPVVSLSGQGRNPKRSQAISLRSDGSREGIGREGLQVKDLVFGREDQA